jgi:hypothetical protein
MVVTTVVLGRTRGRTGRYIERGQLGGAVDILFS